MMDIRENWRLYLLVVFLLLSTVALFAPGAPGGSADAAANATTDGLTNLQYGIQLSGGTRLRAPPVGLMGEGIDVSATEERELAANLSTRLGLDEIDVRVSAESGTAEVFSDSVSESAFREALEAEGYEPESIREGVTAQTMDDLVERVDEKLSQSALSGGSVQQINAPGGRQVISITAPDRDREELIDILEDRGVVRVYAVHQNETGEYVATQVLQQEDFANIGSATTTTEGEPMVRVTVNDEVAQEFGDQMVETGFGDGSTCTETAEGHDSVETIEGQCMVTTLNGNPVFVGGVRPDLGQSFANGDFAKDPTFIMTTTSMEEARELELSLKAGRLPAPLDFESGQSLSLNPALADRFKQNSLITGLLAVFAVSFVVYTRYRRPEVAFPMILTALSEVYLLLGFVAAVQYPLNLSHIAGFVAVIGTGVDDLIIIADEILQRGEIATGRVFQNRFRKAFWVIGAAAATTIVAMSPLTVLSLGDLSGFAIITIMGVLIGVLITRPAYGDILRNLVLDED